MNGTIAQIVALTCHANAFLDGKNIEEFFPNNSTCLYCDKINFLELLRTSDGELEIGRELASTPDDWFKYLQSQESIGVRISRIPQSNSDRMDIGFVGQGGIWELEVLHKNNTSSLWQPSWSVWDQNAPENKIWRVKYGKLGTIPTPLLKQEKIDKISNIFLKALKEINDFAISINCEDFFTSNFQKAIKTLENIKSSSEQDWIHKDLCPKSICDETIINILGACQYAFVFGGMGTWNDLYTEEEFDEKEYNEVSENLFSILMEMIVAATNATFYK